MPGSALESGTVAEPRLTRITRALCGCRYSIHDLSRCNDWLALVPGDHAYLRFASDLGDDPATRDGSPQTAVPAVMAWLCTHALHPGFAPQPVIVAEDLEGRRL